MEAAMDNCHLAPACATVTERHLARDEEVTQRRAVRMHLRDTDLSRAAEWSRVKERWRVRTGLREVQSLENSKTPACQRATAPPIAALAATDAAVSVTRRCHEYSAVRSRHCEKSPASCQLRAVWKQPLSIRRSAAALRHV